MTTKVSTRGGARKGAGRPPMNPKDVASEYVPIHMTGKERELCEKAADGSKLSVSAWGRKHLVRKASAPKHGK